MNIMFNCGKFIIYIEAIC